MLRGHMCYMAHVVAAHMLLQVCGDALPPPLLLLLLLLLGSKKAKSIWAAPLLFQADAPTGVTGQRSADLSNTCWARPFAWLRCVCSALVWSGLSGCVCQWWVAHWLRYQSTLLWVTQWC
jgi:hypothetical protein